MAVWSRSISALIDCFDLVLVCVGCCCQHNIRRTPISPNAPVRRVLRHESGLVLPRRRGRRRQRRLAVPHARLQLAHRRLRHRPDLLQRRRIAPDPHHISSCSSTTTAAAVAALPAAAAASKGAERRDRMLAVGGQPVDGVVVLALQRLQLAGGELEGGLEAAALVAEVFGLLAGLWRVDWVVWKENARNGQQFGSATQH